MLGTVRAVFVVAVAFIGLAAGAQTAQAQDKTDKIRDLLEISQMESLLQEVLPLAIKQSTGTLKRLRPDVPEEVWALVIKEGEAAFMESLDAFIEQTVPVYDRIFTEEEIDGMLAFYRTPVGRSVVKKLPQVTTESMMIGQRWGMAVGQEINRRMVSKLQDEGYKI